MQDTAFDSIKLIPKQIEQAWNETHELNFSDNYRYANKVMLVGMGGSIFNYFVIDSLFGQSLKIPLLKANNYGVGAVVDRQTLLIASSYSGTTEEVVYNLKEAYEKGALCTAITSGGALTEFCKTHNLPHYNFQPQYNPSRQPRMGQGYMIFGAVGILDKLAYFKDSLDLSFVSEVEKLTTVLGLSAKELAKKLLNKELVYVAADHLSGNAHIIRNQTNETAKLFATYALVPELNHHLMEGLKNPTDKKIAFVFIDSDLYFERNKKRMLLTQEVVSKNGVEVYSYKAQTNTALAQFVEVLMWGGYLTYYLGKNYQEDPNKIPWVDYFKAKLGKLEV